MRPISRKGNGDILEEPATSRPCRIRSWKPSSINLRLSYPWSICAHHTCRRRSPRAVLFRLMASQETLATLVLSSSLEEDLHEMRSLGATGVEAACISSRWLKCRPGRMRSNHVLLPPMGQHQPRVLTSACRRDREPGLWSYQSTSLSCNFLAR